MSNSASSRRYIHWILLTIFLVGLGTHFYFVTRNFTWGFLIGHEFRQTQTAIIAYYIDLQNNFSLDYDTPILGKPWQFPLELPLYQWAVVGVKRRLALPDFEAARLISIACFYLSLPAFYILLGRCGLDWSRRLLVLTVILCCPVYLFYSRAFLIDPMAFMASVWFLTAFVSVLRTRKIGWAVGCALAGTVAAVIKSVILFVWLVPAALFGVWCLWRAWRDRAPRRELYAILVWGVLPVLPVAIALKWWIARTDAIKAVHPSAFVFTSENLSKGNFGMFSVGSRFDPAMWHELLACWRLAAMSPWLVAGIVGFGLFFCRPHRWFIAGAFGLFMTAQMSLPNAYAYQDYYFYAAVAFLAIAIGFVLVDLVDRVCWPVWVRVGLMAVPFGGLFAAYFTPGGYYVSQSVQSHGGTGLAFALRDYLPKGSVIVGAGMDWAAIIPYYAQHRALLIRTALQNDLTYMERAFDDLDDEDVGVFLAAGDTRNDQRMLDLARKKFDLYPNPTMRYRDIDVYFPRCYEEQMWARVQNSNYESVVPGPKEGRDENRSRPIQFNNVRSHKVLPMVQPAAKRIQGTYGVQFYNFEDKPVIGAHADTNIWMAVGPGRYQATWSFGVNPEAFQRENPRTDGVGFVAWKENDASGERVEVYRCGLTPYERPEDRGIHTGSFTVDLAEGETLCFGTRPDGNYVFDWGMIRSIDVVPQTDP